MSFKWWYDPRNGFQSHWNINLDTKIIIVLQLEPNLWQIEINVKMAAIFDAILDLKNAKPVVTSHPAWISSQRYSPTKYAKNSLLPNQVEDCCRSEDALRSKGVLTTKDAILTSKDEN